MSFSRVAMRFRSSWTAAAAGWAVTMIVTMPFQVQKIVANAFGGVGVLLLSLAEGTAIWGLWVLAIAAGGWLFGFVPVMLFAREEWLLRYRRGWIVLAALLGWMVVLAKFEVWKLVLPYNTLGVRMFVLYSLLTTVFASVSAAVYLRLIAGRTAPSA